jgi:hypothetical protein
MRTGRRLVRLLELPLRTMSAGRLLRPQYVSDGQPGIHDALVPQQGPNYALAKRLQRWRAIVARDAGSIVSINIAPPTRTRSVLKNRALAAAYASAHHFAVEVFEPATANTLMAALLVADLNTGGGPPHEHPWQDEAYAAIHGGLWRAPYQPRSALGPGRHPRLPRGTHLNPRPAEPGNLRTNGRKINPTRPAPHGDRQIQCH